MEGQDGSQIHQKSIKIEFPRPSVSASFFTSIFDRFLLSTSTPWISKKYVFPKEKQGFLKKPPFEDNIDFGIDFGANLPPCWPPKSKIFRNYGLPRGFQKFIVFRIDFFIDFGSVLASNMGPSWGPRRLKIGKMAHQKSSDSFPKSVLNTIFLQNIVLNCFGIDFCGFRARFSQIFE